jgi:hypothetical protein
MCPDRPRSRQLQAWRAIACGCTILFGGSCADEEVPERPVSVQTRIESVASFHTAGQALVVEPADASIDHLGRWVVADRRDKVIKVFATDGSYSIFGRSGRGPGEFQALVGAGLMDAGRDTVYGYDLITRLMVMFNSAGQFAGTYALEGPARAPIAFLRPVGDSLMLGSGWIPLDNSEAIHLYDRRGHHLRSFLRLGRLMKPMPSATRNGMGVVADAREGLIFSALMGYDTVFVHDLTGKLRGSGRLEMSGGERLLRLPERVAANGGKINRPDGSSVQEHGIVVRNVIALGGGLAAIQVAPVEYPHQHDLLSEGGPVLIVAYTGGRRVRVVAQTDVPGALLGRDGQGNALVLRLRGDDLSTLDLLRLRVTATSAAPAASGS